MKGFRLTPDIQLDSVRSIDPAALDRRGIRLVVLDVDNTLTTHNHPDPAPGVRDWLASLRTAGITGVILSNNSAERVAPFADKLGLPFESRGMKPLTCGFRRLCARYGVSPEAVAVVGDQLFTDILGANRAGMHSILTRPIEPEAGPFFRFKRALERAILRDPHWGR